jgi:hypothetical protein
VLTVVLLGFAAFSADVGMALAQRQAVSTGADSAALAIVREQHLDVIDTPRKCSDLKADTDVWSQAEATAVKQLNANSPFGMKILEDAVEVDLDCVQDGKVLRVEVTAAHSAEAIVGRFMGTSEIAFERRAVANLGVANEVGGVLPLAMCIHQADEIMANAAADRANDLPYRAETIKVDKVWMAPSKCISSKGASGNWGWLDLGQGNSASGLGNLIKTGHGGTIDLTGPTYEQKGTPGNKVNSKHIDDGMAARMDDHVTLPVFDKYDEAGGQNVKYNIVGFMTVQLCGFDDGAAKGECFDESVPGFSDDLQLRYVDYSPAGVIGSICELDDDCAFNSYITALTE